MALSWNEIKDRALSFSKEWADTSNEDADAKPFLVEFFNVFGINRKKVGTFEHHVKKLDDHDGYIDLLWKGNILIEMKSRRWGIYIMIISSALFINTVMIFIVPRVERYSQRALIEFLESKKNENCIVETAGFKSYAHFFYAAKAIPTPGDTAKVHYIVTKSNKIEEVLKYNPQAVEIGRQNGWVFFRKNP